MAAADGKVESPKSSLPDNQPSHAKTGDLGLVCPGPLLLSAHGGVLRGMWQTLEHCRPTMLVEVLNAN